MGLGRAKTKSDLVLTPSGGRIFAIFRSERDHKPQYSGCGYTAWSFHTARVMSAYQSMSASMAAFAQSSHRGPSE